MHDRARQTAPYPDSIAHIHRMLGIPEDYAVRFRLPLVEEASELVSIGADAFGREQSLHPRTAVAWQAMQRSAQEDGIALLVVSGYRSVRYQQQLIARKLEAGKPIAEILRVNAAPGYSEHHSGRALDLASPESTPLEQGFETTAAFAWLQQHASVHAFRLSYPRDNPHGILYEPWHWYFTG